MLRGANLEAASFRNATLESTSIEKADLKATDFSNADFRQMERWGEPNFSGAVIDDNLRYRFGIVTDPVVRLEGVARQGYWSNTERQAIEALIARVRQFASGISEAMLTESEYLDILQPSLFRRVLKAAKQAN
jgi:uncharacterized protein YjbI with pentapeptide repeats